MRTIHNLNLLAVVLACVLICTRAQAQQGPTPTSATEVPTPLAANAAAPLVAEQADRLLKQMSDYIGSADQFTFHADISFDHVLPSGQKLQYAATEDVPLCQL